MKNVIAFLILWHFARQFMEKLLVGITLCFGIIPDTANMKPMSQEIHSYFHFRTMISLLWTNQKVQFIIIILMDHGLDLVVLILWLWILEIRKIVGQQ